jgi:hypothetical protein
VRIAILLACMLLATGCAASRAHVPSAISAARVSAACSGSGCSDYDRIARWATDSTVAGAIALVQSSCTNCHVYRDLGTTRLGAPDLTHIGRRLDAQKILEWIRCPECLDRSTSMPIYDALPPQRIDEIVALLRR